MHTSLPRSRRARHGARVARALSWPLVASLGPIGCTTIAAPAPSTAPPRVETPQTCHGVKNAMEPKLTAWDPDERARINALRRQGVIAVHYAVSGCSVELEVLPNCVGKGAYSFSPYPESRQDYVENRQDLFAELPLGAASISGKLGGNRILRTDYLLIGVAAMPSNSAFDRSALSGPDCERATHVVARVYLGGFVLAAGDNQTIRAEASLFGIGAGGDSASKVERVWSGGIASACKQAQRDGMETPQCSVPLQIGLLPLKDGANAVAADPRGTSALASEVTRKPSAEPSATNDPVKAPGGADRNIEQAREILAQYYSDLNAGRFVADRYFAPRVGRYISMRETTTSAIDHYIHEVFPKQYADYSAALDETTLKADGPNAFRFVEHARYRVLAKHRTDTVDSEVRVEIDASGKVTDFQYLHVIARQSEPGD